jgi:hypothetical protein
MEPPPPVPAQPVVMARSDDAYVVGKIMDLVREGLATMAQSSNEAQMKTAEAEQAKAKRDELAITKSAEHKVEREKTIRLLGGVLTTGVVALLVIGAVKGQIKEVATALPLVATAIISVAALLKPRGKRERDHEPEDR